jgi:hypothetical protein
MNWAKHVTWTQLDGGLLKCSLGRYIHWYIEDTFLPHVDGRSFDHVINRTAKSFMAEEPERMIVEPLTFGEIQKDLTRFMFKVRDFNSYGFPYPNAFFGDICS